MAEVTWLGDADPSAQSIEQYGHTFVKGVPTSVPDKDPAMGKFKGMQVFKVGKGEAEPVVSDAPEPVDPDAGTEKVALRRALDMHHVKYDGRSNEETLRGLLAKTLAKEAHGE